MLTTAVEAAQWAQLPLCGNHFTISGHWSPPTCLSVFFTSESLVEVSALFRLLVSWLERISHCAAKSSEFPYTLTGNSLWRMVSVTFDLFKSLELYSLYDCSLSTKGCTLVYSHNQRDTTDSIKLEPLWMNEWMNDWKIFFIYKKYIGSFHIDTKTEKRQQKEKHKHNTVYPVKKRSTKKHFYSLLTIHHNWYDCVQYNSIHLETFRKYMYMYYLWFIYILHILPINNLPLPDTFRGKMVWKRKVWAEKKTQFS